VAKPKRGIEALRLLRVIAALLLVALVIGGIILSRTAHIESWTDALDQLAHATPLPGWLLFTILQIVVAAFGFLPASLMAIAAGAAYGLWWGFLLSTVGTMVGGSLAFLLSRTALRPLIERMLARNKHFVRFDAAVSADGWKSICLMRMSPVMPFAATSYGLGLTSIGLRTFAIGTLASLPALLAYVAIGTFGETGFELERHQIGIARAGMLALGAAATILAIFRLRTLMVRNLGKPAASSQPSS
jgi:uncharacterized membrane protein YdjX (TVP38/TMEM64 family)